MHAAECLLIHGIVSTRVSCTKGKKIQFLQRGNVSVFAAFGGHLGF